MKALKLSTVLVAFCFQCITATAQSDSAAAAQHAMFYADSLVRCAFYASWKNYFDLSLPSAIKYYGGKEGFQDHVNTMYYHQDLTWEEKPEKTKMITLMNDGERWQTVIEKVRTTYIDRRKAFVYSYLIGASEDDGVSWKFVDVGFNANQNVIYIFPDIFSMMPVPVGKTVYEDELLAQEQQAAEAAKKASGKKPK